MKFSWIVQGVALQGKVSLGKSRVVLEDTIKRQCVYNWLAMSDYVRTPPKCDFHETFFCVQV